MSNEPTSTTVRDGTSQAGRLLPALDPGSVRVDERSVRDLLAFARAYAREIKFFAADGLQDGPQALDWRGFFEGVDLDRAAAYAQSPESFSAAEAAPYARPHFALFLAFLKLLGQGRGPLNAFTQRHLDHFYRDVLRMTPKPAVPDRVHVLVDLEAASSPLALPAGTALLAGKDSLNRNLVYRTRREVMVSPVAVAQIRSLHTEISVTGISDACPARLDDAHRPAGFMAMMRIALGQPNPGDPLPVDLAARPPLYPGVPPANVPQPQVGLAEMVAAAALIRRVETDLGLPSFDDYRELTRLRRQRREQDATDWTEINGTLVAAGRVRDPGFDITPRSSRNFNANVAAALGKSIEDLFSELEEVTSMEDAYAALRARRAELGNALAQALAPLTLDQFEHLMQIKTRIDLEWGRIDDLLETAGRRLDPGFDATALRAASGFSAKLAAALPRFSFTGGFDAFGEAFNSVERYFYMAAEGFRFIMSLATRPGGPVPDDWGWQKVHEIVEAAHQEMVYAQRRDALRRVAQPAITAGAALQALRDMLFAVLGENLAVDIALRELYPPPATVPAALAAIAQGRPEAPDWDHVVQVLEIAQRNWQNFKPPAPERVEWRTVHPAADATTVLARPPQTDGQPDQEALPRWKTFGQVPVLEADASPPPAVLGWALSSPLLAMAEGQRSMMLTLGFDADPQSFDVGEIRRLFAPDEPAGAGRPLQAQLSTEEGWLEPDSFKVTWAEPGMLAYPAVRDIDTSKLRALVFTFTLAQGRPALTPPVRAVHGFTAEAPVLRLMMRPYRDGASWSTRYTTLRKLRLVRAQLAVTVRGLENFKLQNDEGVLSAKKPFEPFGMVPAVGSRLYMGHPEVVGKPLSSLQFNLTWMGVPDTDLGRHYARYETPLTNTSFKAVVALSDDGVLRHFSPAAAPAPAPAAVTADPSLVAAGLFDAGDARKPVAVALRPPPNQGRPDLARTSADDVTAWNRHLVCELNPTDFQHAVYPKTAVKLSLAMAAEIASRTATSGPVDASKYQVNTPYTPKLKSLSLDYSATIEFALAAPAGVGAGATPPWARSFHVHPFGHAELSPEPGQAWCALLPPYDSEGELCIGLRNVNAPQNLSLLFQVAEGSANPDIAPQALQWSCLDGNRWRSLHEGGLLADESRGLINTGIVELSLPAVAPSTLLPDGLYWVRAAIARGSAGVCDTVRIHPHAALAVFDNDGNAPDHLAVPLAPGRIKEPLRPVAGVARIRQPYTSFGGKTPEQPADFNVRVSERLRHKRRAVTAWDYERLVLEKFPQIYKVKCLPAGPGAHPRDLGRIVLVVIPDIRNRLPFNPFEPKVPADQIRDIQAFLQDKTPPFATVQVRNAHYVPVKVRCGVRFLPGRDEGYCRQRLMDELNRFLSPWAYDEGADIVIGGSIYANSIINFIDQRDYVDFVAGFKLFTGNDDDYVQEPAEGGYRASAGRPDGVLVAARQHRFDVIPDVDYRVEEFTGINYMMVELDFIPA